MQPDRGIIDWQRSFRSHDQNQPLKGEDAEWGSDLVRFGIAVLSAPIRDA
jgi:hypothetical protein